MIMDHQCSCHHLHRPSTPLHWPSCFYPCPRSAIVSTLVHMTLEGRSGHTSAQHPPVSLRSERSQSPHYSSCMRSVPETVLSVLSLSPDPLTLTLASLLCPHTPSFATSLFIHYCLFLFLFQVFIRLSPDVTFPGLPIQNRSPVPPQPVPASHTVTALVTINVFDTLNLF